MRITKINLTFISIPLLGFIFSFLFLTAIDMETTLGSRQAIQITTARENADSENFFQVLIDEAQHREINIAKLSTDTTDSTSNQVLSLVIGNPELESTQWISEQYPSFNKLQKVKVRELSESDKSNPMGIYLLYGKGENMESLLSDLEVSSGYTGTQSSLYSPQNLAKSLGGTPLAIAYLASISLAISSIASATIQLSKKIARLKLHGANYYKSSLLILNEPIIYAASAFLVAFLVSLLFLKIYNNIAFLQLYLIVSLFLISIGLIACIFTYLLVAAPVFSVGIAEALKGKIPVKSTYLISNIIRVFTIFAIIITSFQAGNIATQISQAEKVSNFWQRNNSAFYIDTIGFYATETEQYQFDSWIKDEITSNNIILSKLQNATSVENKPGLSNKTFLLVNQKYMENNADLISGLKGWDSLKFKDNIQVYSPGDKISDFSEIIPALPYELSQSINPSEISYNVYPAGQDVFLYGASNIKDSTSTVAPIIIYIPQRYLLASYPSLSAWSTQGGVLVSDKDSAYSRLKKSEAFKQVADIKSAKEYQSKVLQENKNDLVLFFYSLVIFLILLVLSTLEYFKTVANENSQTMYKRFIYGWNPIIIWRRYIFIDLALIMSMIYILNRQIINSRYSNAMLGLSLEDIDRQSMSQTEISCFIILLIVSISIFSIMTSYISKMRERARVD